MKTQVIILLMICWPVALSAQDKKAMHNKLKSVTTYEQKYLKGAAGKNLIESVVRYDQSGNVVEETDYKAGKVDKHMIYQYDQDNNKVSETELDATGKKIKFTEYKYNSNNLRTEKIVYDGNNQVLSRKTYKYETF
jgi:hypothetical protein